MKIIRIFLFLFMLTNTNCRVQLSDEEQALASVRANLMQRFNTEAISVGKGIRDTEVEGVLTEQMHYIRVLFANSSILNSWSESNIREVAGLLPLQSFQPLDSVFIIIRRSEKDTLNQIMYSFSPDSLARLNR